MSAFVLGTTCDGDGVAGDGGAGQGATPDRRAGMGGAESADEPESMDAKLCEDCEAGDGGAGQGAAPDRRTGMGAGPNLRVHATHVHKLSTLKQPMGRRTGLRQGRRSPNSRLLPRAAVAGPTAWMRSSTRIQQKITRPASARSRVAFADLRFRRSQLVAGGLSAAPVSRLDRWRPISADESRSQGGEKLSNRDGENYAYLPIAFLGDASLVV